MNKEKANAPPSIPFWKENRIPFHEFLKSEFNSGNYKSWADFSRQHNLPQVTIYLSGEKNPAARTLKKILLNAMLDL